ncbi:MAG: hypothetical protein SCM11_00610 [Bacillota bacterium]|nr:hypothetical protein [Bacillota bacterium]
MDKGLLYFFAITAGLIIGLVICRRWRPLLAERWRGLFLIVPAIVISALPFIIWQLRPEWIWSDDRSYLMSLILLRSLVWILILLLNLLPVRWFPRQNGCGLTVLQKIFLLPVIAGLTGEAIVLLFNNGIWPVSDSLLTQSVGPAVAAGIRNNAYLFLRVIDQSTRLPWLGQIWSCPRLCLMNLAVLPTISPAEVTTAIGLFGIGLSQYFAPDCPVSRRKKPLGKSRSRKIKCREFTLKGK